jgi:hypothetical protein
MVGFGSGFVGPAVMPLLPVDKDELMAGSVLLLAATIEEAVGGVNLPRAAEAV